MSSNTTLRKASVVAARFGSKYGYRFEGDNVTLDASVQLVHFLEQEVQWLLQLHASPTNGASAKTHFTHVIAEAALPPLAELTSSGDISSLTTLALPPAGQGEFLISLALIARQNGQPDELHDIAIFSRPERFLQPRLVAPLTCGFTQNELTLAIAGIENPRDAANVSGTLSLEIWALNAPYEGGLFSGQPLAGTILGRLAGQESWSNINHTLHYAPPTNGNWQVTVMLREWTEASYTTRDFLNLSEPLLVSAEKTVSESPVKIEPPAISTTAAVSSVSTVAAAVTAPAKTKPAQKDKGASKSSKLSGKNRSAKSRR